MSSKRDDILDWDKLQPISILPKERWEYLTDLVRKSVAKHSPVVTTMSSICCCELDQDRWPRAIYESQRLIDMDAVKDSPKFRCVGLPLPFAHFDVKKDSGSDDEMFDAGGRRIGEMLDKVAIALGPRKEGEVQLHGLFNHENRAKATNDKDAIAELRKRKFYGPFLYVGPAKYTDGLVVGSDIPESAIKVAVSPTHIESNGPHAIIQASPDVFQVVIGMRPNVVWWETEPGRFGFKVIACIVLNIREDYYRNVGLATIGE